MLELYMSARENYYIFLACLGLSLVLNSNTLTGSFVYDDVFFANRPELHQLSYLPRLFTELAPPNEKITNQEIYRPLSMLTFGLNYIFFGNSPVSFHITNIVLNGLVMFMIYLLIRTLFPSNIRLAIIVTLLFGVLPIHTEAVAFIKSRDELLSTLFFLSGWWVFLRLSSRTSPCFSALISSPLLLMAFFSKEFSLIYPAIIIIAFWFIQKLPLLVLAKTALAFLPAIMIFYAFWQHVLGPSPWTTSLHSVVSNPIAYADLPIRIFSTGKIAVNYIFQTFIPYNLSATYRYNHFPLVSNLTSSPVSWLGFGLLLILLILSVHPKTRTLPLGLGSQIFLISYFPFSKFVFTGGEFIAEHWMYFPSLGLVLIAGYLFHLLFIRYPRFSLFLGILFFITYSALTLSRNRVWQSEEALYSSMVRDAPNALFGHQSLARHYLLAGKPDLAYPAITRAMEIYSSHPDTLDTYSAVMFERGDYPAAKKAIETSISLDPDNSSTQYFYALILTKMGNFAASQNIILGPLASQISRPEIRFLAAVNYFRMDQPNEAQRYFDWNPKLTHEQKISAIKEF